MGTFLSMIQKLSICFYKMPMSTDGQMWKTDPAQK